MEVDVGGVISVILFYLLILGVGIFVARWKSRKAANPNSEDELMVAGRNIGFYVGIFTMTATWVGGGYINGSTEAVYTSGLLWCQPPIGSTFSLILGGLIFAEKMREAGYVTMLDPLQKHFGERMGGLLFLPALLGEIFWGSAIVHTLGSTLSVIIGMEIKTSVILSTVIVVLYTMVGGLYSVAYTDIIQLLCIFLGLWITIPFAWTNEAVKPISGISEDLIGTVEGQQWGPYMDNWLLLIFGGIPWQVYFQRVLSSKNPAQARTISLVAAACCILMAVPAIILGVVAKNTDWSATPYGKDVKESGAAGMTLPLVMKNLTPQFIAYLGLGAVSGAVMSSADSIVLSASSVFARNIYRLIFRQKASENEIVWVMRISVFVVGGLACFMALSISTIYGLWILCADLVYVILFPQLLMVVQFPSHCNLYRSVCAYFLSLFLRIGGGEPLLNIPAFIYYPGYDANLKIQYFPFRTLSMIISLMTLISISKLTQWIFKNNILNSKFDIFKCAVNSSHQNEVEIKLKETKDDDGIEIQDTKC